MKGAYNKLVKNFFMCYRCSSFLAGPSLVIAPNGLFDRWLASTGKLGGQRKVPRLNNNRDIMDQILKLMK